MWPRTRILRAMTAVPLPTVMLWPLSGCRTHTAGDLERAGADEEPPIKFIGCQTLIEWAENGHDVDKWKLRNNGQKAAASVAPELVVLPRLKAVQWPSRRDVT